MLDRNDKSEQKLKESSDDVLLRELGFNIIKELETDRGLLASGREEIYGCIFGRDSLISSLLILRAYEKNKDYCLLSLVRKILENLLDLTGKEVNIESGEEPGKCIHEYRPERHEHLTGSTENPWYLYSDQVMRNYDSLDATPLLLIAIHQYIKVSGDNAFFCNYEFDIKLSLKWILDYGDKNADGFLDYELHPERKYGGLKCQSWMDSFESVFHESGIGVEYPVAPVEVQAYAYSALRLWGEYFNESDNDLVSSLNLRSELLKISFNDKFVIKTENEVMLASGIDGKGDLLTSPRSSMGHCLWAAWGTNEPDSVLHKDHVEAITRRILKEDLFDPMAGIRTLSSRSQMFDPYSYHNGSIWPHDTCLIALGMENFGFNHEAKTVRNALKCAIHHFQTPIELFTYVDGSYGEFQAASGQTSCKKQAWCAASLLTL